MRRVAFLAALELVIALSNGGLVFAGGVLDLRAENPAAFNPTEKATDGVMPPSDVFFSSSSRTAPNRTPPAI